MRSYVKRATGIALVSAMTMGLLAGCGNSDKSTSNDGKKSEGTKSFIDLNVGEDYKDLKADLKILTNRTDLVDTTFKEYITQFQKLYPNIQITYEGITDYDGDVMTRLTTKDWGDICMIPSKINKVDYPSYFLSYGETDKLSEKYNMLNDRTYDNQAYGIPSVGNIQGIVYNKKVFADAGITELPKTPDDFLAALKTIKEKTDAIPLYTNFAAGWTVKAWDAYIGACATGSADYMNTTLEHTSNPFSKAGDGEKNVGPYAVYYTLYNAVNQKLVEDDPTTSDWEGSKTMLAKGQIGCMVLGSWSIVQMQQAATDAGEDPTNIAYMPFPITVDGKQYASASPDYNYGINVNSSADDQLAAQLYVKWLTEKSGFAESQASVPLLKGQDYPEALAAFDSIEIVYDNPAPEGEEELFNELNETSELGINSSETTKLAIVEAALHNTKSLDDIMNEWNQKWTDAQKSCDVEIK